MKKENLIGQTFGRLIVIGEAAKKGKRTRWICMCVCGNLHTVDAGHLKDGHSKSCGCSKGAIITERKTTHGQASMKNRSAEYNIWSKMKERCYNEKVERFPVYGRRGIKVCDRWLDDFQFFFDDMGQRPSPQHSIDRINNDGNYEPSNCKWSTNGEQSRNKRNNVWFEVGGIRLVQKDWADKLGVTDRHIRAHLFSGKSFSEIVTFYEKKLLKKVLP